MVDDNRGHMFDPKEAQTPSEITEVAKDSAFERIVLTIIEADTESSVELLNDGLLVYFIKVLKLSNIPEERKAAMVDMIMWGMRATELIRAPVTWPFKRVLLDLGASIGSEGYLLDWISRSMASHESLIKLERESKTAEDVST